MKVRAKEQTVNIAGSNKKRVAIENYLQLEDYVSFQSIKGAPGAALLSDGRSNYQFRFCFATEGLHPTASDEAMEISLGFLEDGFKAFPAGESMYIVQAVKPDNTKRLESLRAWYDGAPTKLFAEMVRSAASPSEYFTRMSVAEKAYRARSRYKQKRLRIYVTVSSARSRSSDITERFISKGQELFSNLFGNLTGSISQDSPERIKRLFRDAENTYADWANILTNQMRLPVHPLTVEEMAQEQWEAFNLKPMPELPQMIYWNGEHLRYEQRDQVHLSSWLFSERSAVPRASRDYVMQDFGNGNRRYSGVVTMRDKPGGWANASQMLKYLYGKTEGLYDFKIVVTITKASAALTEKNLELLQRQAQDARRMADKRGLPSTRSQELQREADEAVSEVYSGNVPLKMSLCFVVSTRSLDELQASCKRLQSRFALPASFETEADYTYQTWLQCFPQLSWDRPLFKPYDRTRAFLASNIGAFMPIVKSTSPDKKGLEFVTEDEATPFYLDIATIHRHILFLAITRAGKSVLFAQILMLAMCSDVPMVVVDYPRESGESTFGPITHLAGKYGAYLNIAEESNNFFEPPDLSNFDADERVNRLIEVRDYVLDILMIIMFGPDAGAMDREKRTAKSIIGNLLNRFYADPDIAQRFERAAKDDVGGADWANAPTLKDFSALCTRRTLADLLDEVSDEHIQLINELRLRYEAFMATTVGRSMSRPTSIPRDAKLLVFAFKGVRNNDDAAILMASASAAAMRRTLSAPRSILFLDEASILSKFPALMAQAARIAANGAKAGIRLMMALQTPASLASSEYGKDILANMATRLIGRIDEADIKNYCEILSLPREVISVNTSKSFYPNLSELYSRWLVVDRGQRTFVRSYAPPLLLAAVANNTDEEAAKKAFLAAYPDEVDALKAFAKELIAAGQENRPIRCPEVYTERRLHAVS
ncbi:MAG: hypothetical protein AAF810_08750 [Cyanobacteria bacterium P01_D01_bin.36]